MHILHHPRGIRLKERKVKIVVKSTRKQEMTTAVLRSSDDMTQMKAILIQELKFPKFEGFLQKEERNKKNVQH